MWFILTINVQTKQQVNLLIFLNYIIYVINSYRHRHMRHFILLLQSLLYKLEGSLL